MTSAIPRKLMAIWSAARLILMSLLIGLIVVEMRRDDYVHATFHAVLIVALLVVMLLDRQERETE